MSFKNYYAVLGVSPDAPEDDIKKKFRKLALQYHPDRNADNEFAAVQFREIQEAYEILSDLRKRTAYNREWRYNNPHVKKNVVKEINPETVLQNCIGLKKQVQNMDPFRLNKQFIKTELQRIIPTSTIALLLYHNNKPLNRELIQNVLEISSVLPVQNRMALQSVLIQLADSDSDVIASILQNEQKIRTKNLWERYSPLLALAIALAACVFIYLLSR